MGFAFSQKLAAQLHQQRGGRAKGFKLEANALRGGVPGRGMNHPRQVVQGVAHPFVIDKAFNFVPQCQAGMQGFGWKFPTVSDPGGDGQDFERSTRGNRPGDLESCVNFFDC